MQAELKVSRKELNNGLAAVLVSIDGQEGMTLPEVVRVFGILEQTVTKHIKSKGFEFSNFSGKTRQEAATAGVISLTGRPPRIVPQAAIESLVRFISTEATDAIYEQLWGVTKAVGGGDINAARNIVGAASVQKSAQDVLDVILHLQAQVEFERRTKGQIRDRQLASAMGTAGAMTKKAHHLQAVVTEKDAILSDRNNTIFHQDNTIFALQRQVEALDSYCVPGEWLSLRPVLTSRYVASTLGKALKSFSEKNGFKPLARTTSGSTPDGKSWNKSQPTYSSACVDAFISSVN